MANCTRPNHFRWSFLRRNCFVSISVLTELSHQLVIISRKASLIFSCSCGKCKPTNRISLKWQQQQQPPQQHHQPRRARKSKEKKRIEIQQIFFSTKVWAHKWHPLCIMSKYEPQTKSTRILLRKIYLREYSGSIISRPKFRYSVCGVRQLYRNHDWLKWELTVRFWIQIAANFECVAKLLAELRAWHFLFPLCGFQCEPLPKDVTNSHFIKSKRIVFIALRMFVGFFFRFLLLHLRFSFRLDYWITDFNKY